MSDPRIVCWFSNGAASAIATKMALARFPDATVACIDTGSEHPDNERFQEECQRWFGTSITVLKSEKYVDIWDVFERTRYLVGPGGARCTGELKKAVRYAFQRTDDINVFGYTADAADAKRARRFIEQNPGVSCWFPLVTRNITKGECLSLIERAGITLPAMYRLGYRNNNCVGCVKGGMGYWNKIRVDFPDVFDRMAAVERSLGHTVLRSNGEPVYLDELDPNRGNYASEDATVCSLDCQTVESEYESSVSVALGRL